MTWGAVAGGTIAAAGSLMGGKSSKDATQAGIDASWAQYKQGRSDLTPYREFGADEVSGLRNWLASPEGAYRPTAETILSSPGYDTRLAAVENSAAARGGLLSGNALRDIGEFGASEYDREIARRNQEMAQRLQLVNLGYGAAGGSAGLAQDYGRQVAGLTQAGGQSQANMWNQLGQTGAGVAGAVQGQQNWNAFLDRFGGEK